MLTPIISVLGLHRVLQFCRCATTLTYTVVNHVCTGYPELPQVYLSGLLQLPPCLDYLGGVFGFGFGVPFEPLLDTRGFTKGFFFKLDYLGWGPCILRSVTTEYKGLGMAMAYETSF